VLGLNHILLFIAIVSPLILLIRIGRLRNPRNHGWRIAALIVLAICAAGWVLMPGLAGYIGGAFWCLLLVLPSVAERGIDEAILSQRFDRARQIAMLRRLVHPWSDSPYQPRLLQSVELAAKGQLHFALDRLATEREKENPSGPFASALTFALTENWGGLVQWCRQDLTVTSNPAVLTLYLRALGEVGAVDDLILQVATQLRGREPDQLLNSPFGFHLALALAFAGKTKLLADLLVERLNQMPEEQREFWMATAEVSEGKVSVARQRLEKLRGTTHDAVLQRSIDRLLRSGPPPPVSARAEMLLGRLVGETVASREATAARQGNGAPAVWAMILLNLAMFGVEILSGGATNPVTLDHLGALEPDAVLVRHEYWRLLTALFLHYGVLHIAFNLYALYLLGPALEQMIGSFKFLLSYLISGLGSSAGVVLLRMLHLTKADQLVGASGCVMGVIGVSAGLLLRHRQSPLAGRRLRNILVIVALQTVFDLTTPQVSLGAHLSGFTTGLVVGIILAARRRPLPD
jgi:rhomboid protease GluP